MKSQLLEERTSIKIGVPARGGRVRCAPDARLAADADGDWVDQPVPDDFFAGHPFAGVSREPVSAANGMPVLDDPPAAFARMPVSGPVPNDDRMSGIYRMNRAKRKAGQHE